MNLSEEYNPIQSEDLNNVLTNTFFRMFLGLLASGITAFYAYFSGIYIESGIGIALIFLEFILILCLSFGFKQLSPIVVTILYYAYAFLNGFSLSIIFSVYEINSICYAFLSTSILFGILAFLGYKTEADISNFGAILITSLIIGIVITFLNLFFQNSFLDVIINWAILIIFLGLTIYDVNKIKRMQTEGFCDNEKLYIYAAMELYLDFINIFLRVLSLKGKRSK